MAEPNKAASGEGKNGEPQGEPNNTQAKGEEKKGEGQGNNPDLSNYISKDEYEKSLKERDGTISSLTKQLETLKTGLTGALGLTSEEKKTTEDLVASLQDQVNTLQKQNKMATAKNVVNDVLDSFKDDEGNELSAEAKTYLRKKINVENFEDEENFKENVQSEIRDFTSVLGNMKGVNVIQKGNDRRPPAKGQNAGRDYTRKPTANDILNAE